MSIRVNWVNPNPNFDKIYIYRSLEPIDIAALPAPLTTLTTGTTYLDTTSVVNTLYWYAVGVEYGGDIIASVLEPAIQLLDYGPGPKELLCGDMNHGYFGTMLESEFVSYATLAAYYGLVVSSTVPFANRLWGKFAYGGKILYMPYGRLCDAVQYTALYGKGIVFGIDGPGVVPSGASATNQRQVYPIGDSDFIVRCARGGVTPNYAFTSSPNSEYWRCIAALIQANQVVPAKPMGYHSLDVSAFSFATSTNPYAVSWLMENNAGSQAFGVNMPNTVISVAAITVTVNIGWRPTLELIQPTGA